jgi:predicted AAA+ superfamily ATPase
MPLQVQLDGYLERIVERDMNEGGHTVRRPATLTAWLRAYAAAVSTTTSWDKVRDAASPGTGSPPARKTTVPYIDTLTRLRILDEVPAWIPSNNHLQRLTQAPKHHLADPALAARLVGATRASLLRGAGAAFTPRDGTYLGQLFESLATLSVRVFVHAAGVGVAPAADSGRREVDLILERDRPVRHRVRDQALRRRQLRGRRTCSAARRARRAARRRRCPDHRAGGLPAPDGIAVVPQPARPLTLVSPA